MRTKSKSDLDRLKDAKENGSRISVPGGQKFPRHLGKRVLCRIESLSPDGWVEVIPISGRKRDRVLVFKDDIQYEEDQCGGKGKRK